jgi:hypothetical protein
MKNNAFTRLKLSTLLVACLTLFAACGGDDDEGNNPNPKDPTNPSSEQEQKGDDEKTEQDEGDSFVSEAWYETNYWDRTDREKAGLRGKVKKWHLDSGYHTEYEYDEAGHLTFSRAIDPNSTRPEWCTWYSYDDKGRLIKEVYGRASQKGGREIDESLVIETTEYEYNNGDKYVWVDPQSFDSRTFVNFLGPENRDVLNNLRKGLSVRRYSSVMFKSGHYATYTYRFDNAGALVISYDSYTTDENGNPYDNGENSSWTYQPITYQGNYPYSGALDEYNTITSMTWRQNGMPLTVDGASGLTEYSQDEKRYINPVKWTCKEGKPLDALFGFTFSREWTYDNKTGELTQLNEWENQTSDRPWTRPTKYEYTYDAHGNWTSYKQEYMVLIDGPDAPVQTGSLSRTIEYY